MHNSLKQVHINRFVCGLRSVVRRPKNSLPSFSSFHLFVLDLPKKYFSRAELFDQ
jgi:hypothetical protein